MTATKYRATFMSTIAAVTIEKETAQCVWIKGWTFDGDGTGPARKHPKRGTYENYFDTWDEAKAFLVAEAEGAVTTARLKLQAAEGHLGNVKGMKPPEDAA